MASRSRAAGAVGIGALAIGAVKYKVQSGLFRRMIEAAKPLFLDFRDAFRAGARARWLNRTSISRSPCRRARWPSRRGAPARARRRGRPVRRYGYARQRRGQPGGRWRFRRRISMRERSLAAAERLARWRRRRRASVLVYGSGLRSRTDLLAQLGRRPPACSATRRRRSRARRIRASSSRFSIGSACPHPAVAYAWPADPTDWLMKRVGGSGGGHTRRRSAGAAPNGALLLPAPSCRPCDRRVVPRRRAQGAAAGLQRAMVVGPESFRFGGLLQPAAISKRVGDAIPAALDGLVRELGLVGLNSLDLIVDGDAFPHPRSESAAGRQSRRLRSCRSRRPVRPACRRLRGPPARALDAAAAGDGDVGALCRAAAAVPQRASWPAWVADRPAPGARIEAARRSARCWRRAPSRAAARVHNGADGSGIFEIA